MGGAVADSVGSAAGHSAGRMQRMPLAAGCVVVLLGVAAAAGGIPWTPVALLEWGAVFAAAAVSSVAGFAFSGLCGAFLEPIGADPVEAVRIMLVASIAIQVFGIWSMRRALEWRPMLPFLAGGPATLPVGVRLLLSLPRGGHAGAFGAVLVGYGAWVLLRPSGAPAWAARLGRFGDLFAGAVGGITGGLAAFPGAAVVAWCGLRRWPKERQRAVLQPFILAMQLATLGLIAVPPEGVQRAAFEPATLGFLPPALLGTLCGLHLFRTMTDRRFAPVVNLLLIGSGLGLML